MKKDKVFMRKVGAVVSVAFVVSVAMLMMLNGTVNPVEIVERVKPGESEAEWREVMVWTKEDGLEWLGAEASQANSGYLGIYFLNHSAGPVSAYTRNASTTLENYSTDNSFGYAHVDSFDLSFGSSDAFDIVVRCKFVRSNGPWNGSSWRNTWVRVNITLTGGVVISDVTGTWLETFNSSSKGSYFGNVYWNGGGSGYTLAAGDSASIVEVSIEAKSAS